MDFSVLILLGNPVWHKSKVNVNYMSFLLFKKLHCCCIEQALWGAFDVNVKHCCCESSRCLAFHICSTLGKIMTFSLLKINQKCFAFVRRCHRIPFLWFSFFFPKRPDIFIYLFIFCLVWCLWNYKHKNIKNMFSIRMWSSWKSELQN